jgi:hypothetical protein
MMPLDHEPSLSQTFNCRASFFAVTSSFSSFVLATSTIVRFLPEVVNTRPTRLGENEIDSALNGTGAGPDVRLLVLAEPVPLLFDLKTLDDEDEAFTPDGFVCTTPSRTP